MRKVQVENGRIAYLTQFCVVFFSLAVVVYPQWGHKHKTEPQIAALTPTERVDEWVKEQLNHLSDAHQWDPSDVQYDLLKKYLVLDGVSTFPRIIKIIDQYDPTRISGRSNRKANRFEAVKMILEFLDNRAFRLRSVPAGLQAMTALENAIRRMREAGYVSEGAKVFRSENGILESAELDLRLIKGSNFTDDRIQDTFRYTYKVKLTGAEMLEFSNFLTEHYPDYPGWQSESKQVRDETTLSPGGFPIQIFVILKPERYYEIYKEFKSTMR